MARTMATIPKQENPSSQPDTLSYPLRVARIDMGSNAIRFLAVELGEIFDRSVGLRFLGEEQPIEAKEEV